MTKNWFGGGVSAVLSTKIADGSIKKYTFFTSLHFSSFLFQFRIIIKIVI